MEFRYSSNDTPVIEFDKNNYVAFSFYTKNDVGYTMLHIKANTSLKIKTRKKNGKRRAPIKIETTPETYLTDMYMLPLPQDVRTKNPYFKASAIKPIKDAIEKHLVDGVFPYSKVKELELEIKSMY